MKIENVSVAGFQPAIRGMRNPYNSWDKSDSVYCSDDGCDYCKYNKVCTTSAHWKYPGLNFCIGENDLKLMRDLAKAGPEHRKYARMIIVYMDITAARYWWHEFDTYKVGVVENSCSTMHTLTKRPIGILDFEESDDNEGWLEDAIVNCEKTRQRYLETKSEEVWRYLIHLLPQSYLQKRTVVMNYETCYNIYCQRKGHKLKEWEILREAIEKLPYFKEIFDE